MVDFGGAFGGFVFSLALGLLASVLAQVYLSFTRKQVEKPTLQVRVESLTNSLQESVRLLDEIQKEIVERHELAEKLQTDARKYGELASLKKSQAEALLTELKGTMKDEGRRSFWKGAALNLVFFVLGYAISLVTGLR